MHPTGGGKHFFTNARLEPERSKADKEAKGSHESDEHNYPTEYKMLKLYESWEPSET